MNDLHLPQEFKDALMRRAAELASYGFGRTAPNPCVGAVLTHNGTIVAEGYHKRYGGAHAEVEAIEQGRAAGLPLAHCTLWVTLEPCNHQGKTPPCTRAILEAGIGAVGIGTLDPNPDVQGGGAAFLRAQGVAVQEGILESVCRDLLADFHIWQSEKRPFVLLKLAATLDGKIATRNGHSAWVSGVQARQEVHWLRSRADAVLIGGGTLRADNPRLTCRLDANASQPLALVVTTQLPHPDAPLHLLRHRPRQTLFWTTPEQAQSTHAEGLQALGCQVWELPRTTAGTLDLQAGLSRLYDHGGYTVLCEGGGHLALRLAEQTRVDRLRLYLAPKILGDAAGINLFTGRTVTDMDHALTWRYTNKRYAGEDLCVELSPQPGKPTEN